MTPIATLLDGESLVTPELLARHAPSGRAQPQADVESAALNVLVTLSLFERRFQAEADTARVFEDLLVYLHRERGRHGAAAFAQIAPRLRSHPIAAILHQDPFTDWSFRKPRGYSGDAHLLDFIYGHRNVERAVTEATDLGRAIYDYTRDAASSVAVRERRDLLARLVDRIAAETGEGAEILTLAAGHLREAALSAAFREGRIGRWVALDQDPSSVAAMAEDYAGSAVEPVDGSVKTYLAGTPDLGSFDLVYAAGLYDYLPRAVAIRLTRQGLRSLKPGGTFLFANFAQDMIDDAYREAFMNWELILRSPEDMWEIINMSVDRNTVEAEVTTGENGVILYGTIRKTG